MKNKIKKGVSVIIPTFNRVKFLYPTLLCLMNQTVEENLEYEIVIVDSGDDETESVVQRFQNSGKISIVYKKIKKCKNRSLLRNTGADCANYFILCFLDNDILVPPDFIQTHFDEHIKNEHTVLLGCRKSLLHFDIAQIGEEALQTNFNILEQLPFYTDERLQLFNKNEPWRFVFSHTLSVERTDYIKAGGFNRKFGEYWGFEDLDLGFNLQLIGCKFKLLTTQFAFHQPHFAQSNKEQHEMTHNAELFIQLHNCFECEIYESFNTNFDEFYPALRDLKKEFIVPSKETQKKYELILGCLFSSMDNVSYKNMFLGTCCIKKDKSCKNVLIVDLFFKFPEIIQMSILTEAFRVSDCICIESNEIPKLKAFIQIAKKVGLVINYKTEKGITFFKKLELINSQVFVMLLPDIYESEKRYVYSWLAAYLLKNGSYVSIRDMKKTKNLRFDDFQLPEESQKLIENNFERSFGKTTKQFINSLSMLLLDSSSAILNSKRSFIFHDEDYELKFLSLKFRLFNNANHLNESIYDCLSFLSVFEESKNYEKDSDITIDNDKICCFMENGYKEDGIDLILDAFTEYVKEHNFAQLTIKIPDFMAFENVVFELHNDSSKFSKLFIANQKRELDIIKLTSKIEKNKLEKNIIIMKKNFSIREIVKFIGENETLLFASRGCAVPPQVYIALILGKKIIIGQHHKLLNWLHPYCSIVESTPKEFANELNVPVSCLNLPYVAYRMNSQKMFMALSHNKIKLSDEVKIKIVKEAYRIIDTYFVKTLR